MARSKLVQYSETFIVPLYESEVDCIFTNSIMSTLKKFNVDKQNEFRDADGITILTPHPSLLFKKIPTINTIVHEISHAAEIILESRGVEAKGEQRAYLEGFIAEKIEQIRDRAKKYFSKHLVM